MGRIKRIDLIILFVIGMLNLSAQPPAAPAGKVWVKLEAMSDEFDTNSPDTDKWRVFDHGDSWDRTAAFDKRVHEAVKEEGSDNYYLTMNPMWYYEDEQFTKGARTYLFAGGGMDTKAMATYGYFEVRVKPSNFPMGSGVFMNSRKASSDICSEKYNTELDICENMSYDGPGANTTSFNNHMNVNSHAKPYEQQGGNCVSLPYETANSGVKGKPLEGPLDFNVVGMWWKNEREAEFFLNGIPFGTITPKRDFNLPMPLIIVMETYTWGDDENNAGNPKPLEYMFEDEFRTKEQRAVTYDWVRTWQLVTIDQTKFNGSNNSIEFHDKTAPIYASSNLDKTLIYSGSEANELTVEILDASQTIVGTKSYATSAGVHSVNFTIALVSPLLADAEYTLRAVMKKGTQELSSDQFSFTPENKGLTNMVFSDLMPNRLPPTTTGYAVKVRYETNGPMEVSGEIRDPSNNWLGGATSQPVSGEGYVTLNIPVNAPTTPGAGYYFKAHIRPVGTGWQSAVHAIDNLPFTVAAPLTPGIKIMEATVKMSEVLPVIDVALDYAAEEGIALELTLVDVDYTIKAQKLRTERVGQRSLIRSIFPDSTLRDGSDYKVIVKMNYNDKSTSFADTVHNIVLANTSNALSNLERETVPFIYPNPTSDEVRILIPKNKFSPLVRLELRDISGKMITAQTTILVDRQAARIDLSGLQRGVYTIRVIDAGIDHSQRIIKW